MLTDQFLADNGLIRINEFKYVQKGIDDTTFNILNSYQSIDVLKVRNVHNVYDSLLLKRKGSNLVLRLNCLKDKYSIVHNYNEMRKYDQGSYEERYNATKDLKEPKKIGLLTEKKVLEWIQYCEDTFSIYMSLMSNLETDNLKAVKKIDDFITETEGKATKYHNRVNVYTKYFDVTFEHDKSDGKVYHKVIFSGKIEDVILIEKAMKAMKAEESKLQIGQIVEMHSGNSYYKIVKLWQGHASSTDTTKVTWGEIVRVKNDGTPLKSESTEKRILEFHNPYSLNCKLINKNG